MDNKKNKKNDIELIYFLTLLVIFLFVFAYYSKNPLEYSSGIFSELIDDLSDIDLFDTEI